jgi:putative transposase
MPNTYYNLRIQLVFAVKGRASLITPLIKEELEKYICSIISLNKSKPLAIYCNPDHVHVLIGLHHTIAISDLAKLIKSNSSKWLNQKHYEHSKFSWQSGYAAFSYSQSHLSSVANYIENQDTHHKQYDFREEYLSFLESENISFDAKYLFERIK